MIICPVSQAGTTQSFHGHDSFARRCQRHLYCSARCAGTGGDPPMPPTPTLVYRLELVACGQAGTGMRTEATAADGGDTPPAKPFCPLPPNLLHFLAPIKHSERTAAPCAARCRMRCCIPSAIFLTKLEQVVHAGRMSFSTLLTFPPPHTKFAPARTAAPAAGVPTGAASVVGHPPPRRHERALWPISAQRSWCVHVTSPRPTRAAAQTKSRLKSRSLEDGVTLYHGMDQMVLLWGRGLCTTWHKTQAPTSHRHTETRFGPRLLRCPTQHNGIDGGALGGGGASRYA